MNKDLLKIINEALDKQGISARQASILATGTPELIRNMRRGSIPSVERFRSLCNVLKLEFHIGPIDTEKPTLTRSLDKKEAIYDMLQEIIARLPPKTPRSKTAEPVLSYRTPKTDTVRYIPMLEMKTFTYKSHLSKDNRKSCYAAFQSDWLDKYNLNPEHCVIVKVCDKSMEPTIPNHSIVLVDCNRRRRRAGNIYAILINNNPIIKRLNKEKDQWLLVGDHPKWKPEPFPASAEIIGEVRWMAKTFE